MRERPILFSGPMVRALLEGRKTQTRRVVRITHRTPGTALCLEPAIGTPDPKAAAELCPYGVPGDRLWVREGFALVPASAYRASEGVAQTLNPGDGYEAALYREGFDRAQGGIRWKPSIHMPRWASRLTLEVTGGRVERVQDISDADARAEGFDDSPELGPRGHFIGTWIALNGLESWQANPWVWVLEFKVVTP